MISKKRQIGIKISPIIVKMERINEKMSAPV
jgi:hypothetical protein